jgi:hypothetical protein
MKNIIVDELKLYIEGIGYLFITLYSSMLVRQKKNQEQNK